MIDTEGMLKPRICAGRIRMTRKEERKEKTGSSMPIV